MPNFFFPNSFISYLRDNDPIFSSLPPRIQNALASTLYGALTNQNPHKFGCDIGVFTIFWKEKQRLFGPASAFKELNDQIRWFTVFFPPGVGSATGYVLTDDAKALGRAYLEQSLQIPLASFTAVDRGFTYSTGKAFRKAPQAVRSKMKSAKKRICNSTRFRNTSLRPSVSINGESVRKFYEAAMRRVEDKEPDVKRIQREATQALAMLDLAKRYGAPDGYTMPNTYVESTKGRLHGEGSLNLQNCVRGLRKAALKGCHDVDVENCHWTILYQLAKRRGIDSPSIQKYLEHTKSTRKQISKDVEITIADAKFILLAMIYGAPLRKSHRYHLSSIQRRVGLPAMSRVTNHPIILDLKNDLQRASKAILAFAKKDSSKPGFIINAAGHQLRIREPGDAMQPSKFKKPKPSRQMAHLLQGQESEILRVCMEWCDNVVIAQHDGFTCREKIDTTALSAVVLEKAGIAVAFSQELL